MYKQVQRFNNILVGWSVKTSKLLSTNSIRNHCLAQLPNFKSNLNYWIVIETLTFNLSTRYEIAWHFPIRHQAVTPKGTVGPHSTIDWIDLGITIAHNTVNANSSRSSHAKMTVTPTSYGKWTNDNSQVKRYPEDQGSWYP